MSDMIEQFSRQQLELMTGDDIYPVATIGEVQALARIALELQDAPGKVYQIRKLDGSEEWQQWYEVSATEYYGSVSNEGWGRRILYTTPADIAPNYPPIPNCSEWTDVQCLEFLTIAFRHNDIAGDINFDDIRLGVKFAIDAAAHGVADA